LTAEGILQEHFNDLKPENAYKLAMIATDDPNYAGSVLNDLVQLKMDQIIEGG